VIELFIADVHLPYFNENAVDIMIDYIKKRRIYFETLVLGGDIMDFESVSSFTHDPDNWSLQSEIPFLSQFIEKLDKAFHPMKIYYIEGNHEKRLENYIITKAPALYGMITIQDMLDKKYQIEYVDNWKLMTSGLAPLKIRKLYHLHGHELKIGGRKNIAERILGATHENTIVGHWHKTDEYFFRTIGNKVKGAWVVGCMGQTFVSYDPHTNWNNGFAIIDYLENGVFKVDNLKIINGEVV
jgi:predicted MPP superfamily phosphohydrolase